MKVAIDRGDERHERGAVSRLGLHRTRRYLVAGLVLVAVTACGGGDDSADEPVEATAAPSATAVEVEPGLVTPAQAAELAADGITMIDVRTPEEYAEGHLADATLVDFYAADFAEQIAALPTDGEYLVYCRSGNRSSQAVQLMADLGFEDVYDMDGGIVDYLASGLPLAP